MEEMAEHQEIADGNIQDEAKNGTSLMPDAPGLDALWQLLDDHVSVGSIAACRDKSEKCGSQAFVSLVHAETERLQQKKDGPDDDSIDDAVSQQVYTLLEWICAG